MNPLQREAAESRLLEAALESEARRPPVDQILARRAARPPSRHGRLWAAALMLLGLGVAIGVAVSREGSPTERAGNGPSTDSSDSGSPDTRGPDTRGPRPGDQDPSENVPPPIWHRASTLAEIEALPTDLRALRSIAGKDELAALARFDRIESLALDTIGPASGNLLALLEARAKDAPMPSAADFTDLAKLATLRSLELNTRELTPTEFEALATLPRLTRLTLTPSAAGGSKATLSVANARALSQLPHLQHLEVTSCSLPLESAKALKSLVGLKSLELRLMYELSEAHLLALSALSELEALHLRMVSGKGIEMFHTLKRLPYQPSLTAEVLRAFGHVRTLNLMSNGLSSEMIEALPRGLETLFLNECTLDSGNFDEALDLDRLPALRALGMTIGGAAASPAGVSFARAAEILAERPWTELRLSCAESLEPLLPSLGAQAHLERLELVVGRDLDLSFAPSTPNLRTLHLVVGEEVLGAIDVEEALAPLARCRSLRHVTLPWGTNPARLDAVRRFLPESATLTLRLR